MHSRSVIKRHFVKYFSDYISVCVREEGRDESRREEGVGRRIKNMTAQQYRELVTSLSGSRTRHQARPGNSGESFESESRNQ